MYPSKSTRVIREKFLNMMKESLILEAPNEEISVKLQLIDLELQVLSNLDIIENKHFKNNIVI